MGEADAAQVGAGQVGSNLSAADLDAADFERLCVQRPEAAAQACGCF